MENIGDILRQFSSISLEDMSKVRLMNRVDTKFVTTQPQLALLLEKANRDYYVQEIEGLREMPYYTCYFDTPDCDMFVQHQRGRKNRQKIRMRIYETSGTVYIEIKNKDNRGRTNKKRILGSSEKDSILPYSDFIKRNSRYLPDMLTPRIRNHFYRITLVNKLMTERLTIDTCLKFHNVSTQCRYSLDGLVVIELKRDGNVRTPAIEILRSLHIHPTGFSKYCIGMALTDMKIKQNRLKPRIRMIHRLLGTQYALTSH